jgi:hypothetical protein
MAGWDVSTTETNLSYIRRTIKPALGIKEVRKVRGPVPDHLYTRLHQCGNLLASATVRDFRGAMAGRGE